MSDLISRQDAIDVVGYEIDDGYNAIVDRIKKALPSAEPKTGQWILTPMLSDNYRYECSNCMSHHRARYDYCPSCGSRMFREDGE